MIKSLEPTTLKNKNYGHVYMILVDREPMFSAGLVAKMIGFENKQAVIEKFCKESKKAMVKIDGKVREVTFITLTDVHRLVEYSLFKRSEEVEKWLKSEYERAKASSEEACTLNSLTVLDHDGVSVVDSREVAVMVGKQHKHLLRDISGYAKILEESTESKFGLSDFFLKSSYKDSTGRELPCYLITKKGCDMIANKLTGKKGVLFTAAYVTAFERMRKELQLNTYIDSSDLSPQLQLLISLERKQKEQDRELARVNEKIGDINTKVSDIRDIVSIHPDNWRKECRAIINDIVGKSEYLHKDIWCDIYKLIDDRAGVSLDKRLSNKIKRMEKEGVSQSKCNSVNKLDVIADDKKLIEIYIAIVKEMAVKYGADKIHMTDDEDLY